MAFNENEKQIILDGATKGQSKTEILSRVQNYRLGIKKPTPPENSTVKDLAIGTTKGVGQALQPLLDPRGGLVARNAIMGDPALNAQAEKAFEFNKNATGLTDENITSTNTTQEVGSFIPAALPIAGMGAKIAAKAVAPVAKTALKTVKDATPTAKGTAEALQARATRLSPSVRNKFTDMMGETPEQFQVKYGATGTPDKVVTKLYEQFSGAREAKKAVLASARPERFQVPAVKDALDALKTKVANTSTQGAPNPISSDVENFVKIYDSQGLTVSQENLVKELYERHVKLDFLKENVPDNVSKANFIDNQLRSAVEKHAEQLGIEGVKEQNKIIQATRMLMDEIGAASNGRAANNILGLTDTILASQIPATPEAIALFLGKKTLSSESALGAGARLLSPKPKPTTVINNKTPHNPVRDLGNPSKPKAKDKKK